MSNSNNQNLPLSPNPSTSVDFRRSDHIPISSNQDPAKPDQPASERTPLFPNPGQSDGHGNPTGPVLDDDDDDISFEMGTGTAAVQAPLGLATLHANQPPKQTGRIL